VIRRLLRSARRLRVKARRLPRPWPFVKLLAVRPRARAATPNGDVVTLRTPTAEETLAVAAGGARLAAVWPDTGLKTNRGRDAFERWHREVTNAGLLHAVVVERSEVAES
jgi:hypothetical protein